MAMAPSACGSHVAPADALQAAMLVFDSQPYLCGEPTPETEQEVKVGVGSPEEDNLEFELWVETDIDAAWCLPGNEAEANQDTAIDATWRQDCTTSTMRRSWEDFERLGKPGNHVGDRTLQEAFDKLGLRLTDELDAKKAASAFRRLSLTCHPDKVTTPNKTRCEESFDALVSAYQVVQRALADNRLCH